jgi:hypothetical protein
VSRPCCARQPDGHAPDCTSATGAYGALRERVARAIAEAADDGVFDRDEPDCTSDDEDRAYWLRLADAALGAHASREEGPR